MKKTIKNLLVFVIMFVTFISFNVKVSAKTVDTDDIGANTYIIGNSMFTREQTQTYDGVLTTQRIMLASKTIEGSNIADMVIYYKNARGIWVNAINNEEITPPVSFKILNENMEALPDVPVPAISVQYQISQDGELYADIGAHPNSAEDFECHDNGEGGEECTYAFERVEIFENGNDTAVLTIAPATVEMYYDVPVNGTTKTLTAKSYIMNGEEKVYSDPVQFTLGVTIPSPTIAVTPVGANTNNVAYEFVISSLATDIIPGSDEFSGAQGVGTPAYAGVDLFNKANHSLIGTISNSEGGSANITADDLTPNAVTTVYGLGYFVVNNEKVYGSMSNEITIDKTIPEVVFGTASANGSCTEGICSYDFDVSHTEAAIEATINNEDFLKYQGVDLFKVGSDTVLATGTTYGVTITNVAEGTEATYYVKPFNIVNSEKVYGPASNTIKVVHIGDWDINETQATKLENDVLEVNVSLDLSSNANLSKFDGYNVYLDNGDFTLLGSVGVNESVAVTNENGSTITVRLYTLNGEEKIEVESLDGVVLNFNLGD